MLLGGLERYNEGIFEYFDTVDGGRSDSGGYNEVQKKERFAHAPGFKATIRVGRVTYTSRLTFPHRKEAEQNIARDQNCGKSILNEYASKTNRMMPIYTTIERDQLHWVYKSSLVFYGKTYRGKFAEARKKPF
ncbi:hypothetical protein GOBAR_AA11494 [Gossypium barbadense]|uniref:Uncharacterized protein n=1 Tax=Gossypium barbadense TaxID=3634 RepID=A0A2P5Y0S1_GOSBA|nr:hypothetical protein GOBAR_AA11494 [Gossypium barbadense]